MKILSITWKDAVGEDSGWCDIEAVQKEELCEVCTTGFLIEEKEDSYTLGLSYDPINKKVAGYLVIPKLLIVKMEELMV